MTEHEREQTTWQPISSVLASFVAQLRSGVAVEGRDEAATRDAQCWVCDGAGYYKLAVPFGHPDFGVLFPCACRQAERAQQQHNDLLRLSNLAAFRDQTFATFDQHIPGVQDAYAAAWNYAQALRGWLIVLGGYGVGKTHLAAAIANTALEAQRGVLLAVVPGLLDYLRATFAPTSDVTYDARFEQVRTVPLLILDDLGTKATTSWAREKLYQLINHRSQERLPTVITSNRALDELEPRLASRLADRRLSQVIVIQAQDYRCSSGRDKLELVVERHTQQKEIG